MEEETLFTRQRAVSLELRLKSCIYLNTYRKGYVQVILVCISLCMPPSPVLYCEDGEGFGMQWGDLSFLSCSILHGNDLWFWLSMANAVTPQTDYLKCYVLHLRTHYLSPQGRRKLRQVGKIIQGLLTDILIFLFVKLSPSFLRSIQIWMQCKWA